MQRKVLQPRNKKMRPRQRSLRSSQQWSPGMTGQSRFNVRADSCQGKPSLATPMNPVQPDPPGSKKHTQTAEALNPRNPPGLRRFPILRRMPGGMRPQTFWHLPHFCSANEPPIQCPRARHGEHLGRLPTCSPCPGCYVVLGGRMDK